MDDVNIRINFQNEEALISIPYPVLYRDLLREIRKIFLIDSDCGLIIHYESNEIKRPLAGAHDFELCINYQYHLHSNIITLAISIDQSLPNLELEKGIVNYVTLDKETKDQFIPEDLDPVKALLTASVSDPLIKSHFVAEDSEGSLESEENPEEEIRLIEKIGQGGFGTVYTAYRDAVMVAVKIVEYDPDAEEDSSDILGEIEFLSQIKHPNIVKYINCGRDDNSIFIFMEYMEGGSISQYTKANNGLSEKIVQKYASQILSGLEYLHSKKIVHRDIKGSNLLLDLTRMNVKLSDFGAAKKLATLDRSRTDNLVGTTYWLSPEVIQGSAAGHLNDIWAFGITLIEMLTSRPPFHNYDPLPAMFKIATTPPSLDNYSISDQISPQLQEILRLIFVEENERVSVNDIIKHSWITYGHIQLA